MKRSEKVEAMVRQLAEELRYEFIPCYVCRERGYDSSSCWHCHGSDFAIEKIKEDD